VNAFPFWTQLLYNEPLAIAPFKNDMLCQLAEARMMGGQAGTLSVAALDHLPRASSDGATTMTETGRKMFASKDGIAVIHADGTLVRRGSNMDADSGLIGYDYLLRQIKAAAHDPDIRGTFLLINSPGGHVSRMFEAANEIAMMAKSEGGKPIYAYLDEMACSAAYVLASACDVIAAPRSAMAGCLGVMMNILDVSKAYEKIGIQPFVIRSQWADLKSRPNPGEVMTEEALSGYQRLVDQASDQLVEFVGAMRGLSDQAIKDTRGEVFSGTDMVRLGLVDEIASEREAWSMLLEEARSV
jgi:capsid assembly protease